MRSQEQRITSATLVIAGHLTGGHDQRHQQARTIAIQALEAADREPPTWPHNESVNAYHDAYLTEFDRPPCGVFEQERRVLRDALLADPIIKAALAYVNVDPDEGHLYRYGQAIVDAVREAGL